MKHPEPSICVRVDPANPGQFFACCGLLELADRLWGGAEGWFSERGFGIASPGTIAETLQSIVDAGAEEVTRLSNGPEVKPLIAPIRLSFDSARPFRLTLDAWMTIRVEKGKVVAAANPPWNFWSGQQTSFRIWRDLRAVLQDQIKSLDAACLHAIFEHRVLLSGRFGFDPGAAWNALDVGFSPNEQGMEVASSAAVEMLAAIGIQRFRPQVARDNQSFHYATWGQRLSPSVAGAAAAGTTVVRPSTCFRGRVISRGSYAALGLSTPYRGEPHE
jgi:hypothetical protein